VGTVVPYAQEYRELGANEGFLREVSELTGGGPLSDAKDAFAVNRNAPGFRPICGPGWWGW
jgi:hypothetical protein